MNFELINGSLIDTITYLLSNIDSKLSNTDLENILLDISNNINVNFNELKEDNVITKLALLNILNELNKVKSDNVIIKNKVDEIYIKVNQCYKPKAIAPNPRQTCKPKLTNNNCLPQRPQPAVFNRPINDFIIDNTITSGHTDGYKIYVGGGYTYHDKLYWFISGNKRKLCHKGELTSDMIEIYNKYNIKI